MEKISVIVPVYNMEQYLGQCVDSILKSTYQNLECILVDDGSKDKSPELCDQYAKEDSRIKVIHKINGGLTSARKAGFEIASGTYVCFVDSDDYIAEDMLEKLLTLIEQEQADVSVCGHYQDEDGKLIENTFVFFDKIIEKKDMIDKYALPVIGKIYAKGYINYPGYVWGRLYRKDCIQESCFVSEREVYTEDDLFQMYLSEKVNKVVFTNEKLCFYRVNSNSLTHVYRKNMWEMLKKRHGFVCDFLQANNRNDAVDRKMGSAFYAVYVSITNAYNLNDYMSFKKEAKLIRTDAFSKNILKDMNVSLLRPRQKMFYRLFQLKWYFGMYHLRKMMF